MFQHPPYSTTPHITTFSSPRRSLSVEEAAAAKFYGYRQPKICSTLSHTNVSWGRHQFRFFPHSTEKTFSTKAVLKANGSAICCLRRSVCLISTFTASVVQSSVRHFNRAEAATNCPSHRSRSLFSLCALMVVQQWQ